MAKLSIRRAMTAPLVWTGLLGCLIVCGCGRDHVKIVVLDPGDVWRMARFFDAIGEIERVDDENGERLDGVQSIQSAIVGMRERQPDLDFVCAYSIGKYVIFVSSTGEEALGIICVLDLATGRYLVLADAGT